jgi:hypothetical protein
LRWLPTAVAIVVVCIPVVAASTRGSVPGSDTPGVTTPVLVTLSVLVAAVLVTALLLRARLPLSAASAAIAVTSVTVLLSHLELVGPGPVIAAILTVMITVFGVGSRQGRTPALILVGAAVATIGTMLLVAPPAESRGAESILLLLALVGLAATAGVARFNGRAFIQAITDRAR